MIGLIKTYLPSKKYGFIKGQDGRDYFFHEADFKNKKDIINLSENSTIEFEEKATPKGYRAINCSIVGNQELKYSLPDNFIATKNKNVKNLELVEESYWIIHGSSSNSPDDAKKQMIQHAINIGGNGVIDLTYYKTTGSTSGTGKGVQVLETYKQLGLSSDSFSGYDMKDGRLHSVITSEKFIL